MKVVFMKIQEHFNDDLFFLLDYLNENNENHNMYTASYLLC